MTVACLCVIVQFFALQPVSKLDLPWQVYALGIGIAIGSTVLPIFMISEALKRIGAMNVSTLGAVCPVATMFGAVWILDDPLTVAQVSGAAPVLAGVWLISTKAQKAG
jgi:drug/metabolite transporter (DMT)-like permease